MGKIQRNPAIHDLSIASPRAGFADGIRRPTGFQRTGLFDPSRNAVYAGSRSHSPGDSPDRNDQSGYISRQRRRFWRNHRRIQCGFHPFGRESPGGSQKSSAPGRRDGSGTMAGQGRDRSKTGRPGRKEQSSVKTTSHESNFRLLTTLALLNRTANTSDYFLCGGGWDIYPGEEETTFREFAKGI